MHRRSWAADAFHGCPCSLTCWPAYLIMRDLLLICLSPLRNEIDIGINVTGGMNTFHTDYYNDVTGKPHTFLKSFNRSSFDFTDLHTFKAVWTR